LIQSYSNGDTLSLKVSYFINWNFERKEFMVKGIIRENNGKMVRLEIESFGTNKERIIRKLSGILNYDPANFWINPRYWNKKQQNAL
jgi:hypothetical protein